MKSRNLFMYFTSFFIFSWANWTFTQVNLQYQYRGNRYEGIKPKPISGYDIELISARVDYKEQVKQMPKQLRIKFYLKDSIDVHLIVRELDYKHYYWMDKVQPSKSWRHGFDNTFSWPTQDVIQQIAGLKMYDLAVVARLNRPEPSKVEEIAPVIYYHSHFPKIINGYLFTFKTNGDACLICSIYKDGETKALSTSIFRRQRGGRPFTIRWNSSNALESTYKLVIKGYFLENNNPIDQIVYFNHKPIIE